LYFMTSLQPVAVGVFFCVLNIFSHQFFIRVVYTGKTTSFTVAEEDLIYRAMRVGAYDNFYN
jgi:hypothetical protein